MKKAVLLFLALTTMACSPAVSAAACEEIPISVETWATFNDNQKHLFYAMQEIDGEVVSAMEYLANIYLGDYIRTVVDLLFIEAPGAEDGVYIYDIQTGVLYDHIDDSKVTLEFDDREECIHTIASCYHNYAYGSSLMWIDSEIKFRMNEEDFQEVLDVVR